MSSGPSAVDVDVAIVGAGPAGLSLACALAGSGLRLALIDPQSRAELAQPREDGREIALSSRSQRLLREFGIWAHVPQAEVYPLKAAEVFDRDDARPLRIAPLRGQAALGALVSNHLIRGAAWQAVSALADDVEVIDHHRVTAVWVQNHRVAVQCRPVLADAPARTLHARLLVAADSRFSHTRRLLGIAADSHDFGKTMLVCRMAHSRPHHHIAWEWFGQAQTLAVLPLAEGTSSIVLTLPPAEMDATLALDADAFACDIARRLQHRLGDMRRIAAPHVYPLVGVYARRFAGARHALIGDAAVGMHPVTAHGFNFGLLGVALLAERLRAARSRGADIGAEAPLQRYAAEHRLATRPLYLATQALATLYTEDHAAAHTLRALALDAARRVPLFRLGIAAALSESGLALPRLPSLPQLPPLRAI